jgi:hypothetical protein
LHFLAPALQASVSADVRENCPFFCAECRIWGAFGFQGGKGFKFKAAAYKQKQN